MPPQALGFYMRLVAITLVTNAHPGDIGLLARETGVSERVYRRLYASVADLFYQDGPWLRPRQTSWLQPLRGGTITRLLERLIDRWGPGCVYCGSAAPLEVDHIIPKSRGGADAFDNYAPACGPCNRRKAKKTAAEFGYPEVQERAQVQ